MKDATRYNYEKRIKELQAEVYRMQSYRSVALYIFDAAVENAEKETGTKSSWIIQQFRSLLK